MKPLKNQSAAVHALLGGAVGDSVGLPYEGLHARRIAKLAPGPLKQCLCFGHGMISDDTEHGWMTLLSLLDGGDQVEVFRRELAARLRWWFAGIPAGIGLATARSIIKLWLGARPSNSGVFSAGNGPLMRAVVIGAWYARDHKLRKSHTQASTVMTHSDPIALQAADWIAAAAALAQGGKISTERILAELTAHAEGDELTTRIKKLRQSFLAGDDVGAFADSFSRKRGYVSGYAPDSACVAVYAWLRHRGDYRNIIESVIRAGGDTDTVAYVAGSLAALDGAMPPDEWVSRIRDWPLNSRKIQALSENPAAGAYPVWPLTLVRNALFLVVVLFHGFRRLLPPY